MSRGESRAGNAPAGTASLRRVPRSQKQAGGSARVQSGRLCGSSSVGKAAASQASRPGRCAGPSGTLSVARIVVRCGTGRVPTGRCPSSFPWVWAVTFEGDVDVGCDLSDCPVAGTETVIIDLWSGEVLMFSVVGQ